MQNVMVDAGVILYFCLPIAGSTESFVQMRRSIKEKELEALWAGEHDSCSCFIGVAIKKVSFFEILNLLFTSREA